MRSLNVILALLAAWPLSGTAFAETLEGLGTPGVLRVLVPGDTPPEIFSVAPAHKPGLARELLEGFARFRRLRLQVIPTRSAGQLIRSLLSGQGDLISGQVDVESLRKDVAFTVEAYPVRHLIVSRPPSPKVTSLASLRGQKVAVILGSSASAAAAGAGPAVANQVGCPDRNGLLEALRDGRAAAAVMTVFDFVLAQKSDPSLEAGPSVGASVPAAFAVRKEDAVLRRALDEYLETVSASTARSALLVKYFNEETLARLRPGRSALPTGAGSF
jgi:ABC-type amino acid transport substrate-binding protein